MCRERSGSGKNHQDQAEGHRERGDSDVPEQAKGPGAVHAQEPKTVQAGGDPVRDRLHLRSAMRPGNAPGRERFRRPDGSEPEKVPGSRESEAAVGRQAESEHDSEPVRGTHSAKHIDDRSADPLRQAVLLGVLRQPMRSPHCLIPLRHLDKTSLRRILGACSPRLCPTTPAAGEPRLAL